MLRLVFGEEFSARIHLRTNSFKFRRRRGSAWDTGKQLHIESVIEAANEDAEKKSTAAEEEEEEGGGGAVRGPSLVMTQCALIDDDLRNINVARENGVHSHHFTNDSNLCVLTESRGAGRCISLHLIPHSEMIQSHTKQTKNSPPHRTPPTLIHKRKIDEKIWLQRTLALDPRPRLRLPLRLQLPVQVRE